MSIFDEEERKMLEAEKEEAELIASNERQKELDEMEDKLKIIDSLLEDVKDDLDKNELCQEDKIIVEALKLFKTNLLQNKGYTVLSLFDGISCGQLALKRAGIPINRYYASEIDKYAIQITQKNFPLTIQLGDVNTFESWDLPKIDLLIGGSPCQDLSIAKQDRKGLDGERSGLFWRYVDCLKKFKPRYFLLENVASMPNADKQKITEILGVEPILINSALVSAQQRKRLYWTNIPNIKQPEDKGILLKDIILSGLPYLDKSQVIGATYNKASTEDSIQKHQKPMIAEPIRLGGLYNQSTRWGIYDENGKSPTLVASMGMGGGFIPMIPIKYCNDKNTENIYKVENSKIFIRDKEYDIKLPNGYYAIRKLFPIECERLQTLPDNYTEGVSNSQRYKAIGNGWTVDVITHIFKSISEVNNE